MTHGVFRAIALALAWGAIVETQTSPQQPVYRGATDVVTVDVGVLRRNSPVSGLVASDFELLDNGRSQQIEVHPAEAVPLDVSAIFDVGNLGRPTIGRDFASALTKIAALLRPTDRLQIITFATDVREVASLMAASELERSGVYDRLRTFGDVPTGIRELNEFSETPSLRGARLFDAVLLAAARPPELGRRHLVIAWSANLNARSVLDDGALFARAVERTEALVHVALWNGRINPDVTAPSLHMQYGREAATRAAEATGGSVHDANDAVSAFKSILAEFRQSYVLEYTLSGVPREGWHSLTVTIPKHPDYKVRARTGYLGR